MIRNHRAIVLLEVVVSIGLLLVGLTIIGGQLQSSRESARRGRELARILMLTESKIAELDTGLVNLELEADDEVEGDFTLRFPDYGWRMRFDETATAQLRMITLSILYAPRESLDDDFDLENAEVVHTVYLMRAEPAKVDLQADFGLDESAIAQLRDAIPIEGFDVENFDPAMLASLDTEDLLTLLPVITQMLGLSQSQLQNLMPEEFRGLLDAGGTGESPGGGGADSPSPPTGGRGGASPPASPPPGQSPPDQPRGSGRGNR
jgi:hypothetical protein